jgi:hypothetical protein
MKSQIQNSDAVYAHANNARPTPPGRERTVGGLRTGRRSSRKPHVSARGRFRNRVDRYRREDWLILGSPSHSLGRTRS